ncbi:MAG TPA: ABC transporter ATP-binding protein [Anaerolineaceae bacterium]|nr:ABC transporter ATP-binding protein [Anaerolineaceae bacterium]
MSHHDLQTDEGPAVEASPEDDFIIQAIGVQKVYHTGLVSVPALRGVDLCVRRGEMVAIMGPSGCGKTTLLNCLSGLDTADEGQIAIEGVSLSGMSDRERTDYRARRMGFVFQFYNLLPVLSAVENVELPLLVSGVRPGEARKRSLESLAQVGLAHRAYHRPAELSGGERQRTTIARSLVNQPALVWADEPTGDLDSETANEIMDVLVALNRDQGLTFILVTHDRGVGSRCERIVRMRDGLVVGEQPGAAQER